MVYTAKKAVANAKADRYNVPGMCLAQTRTWAGIGSYWPDASTAWRNATHRHSDKNPPAGAAVYWTGGSHGYGHIALSVGGGLVRSTDAAGSGAIATVSVSWPGTHWGLHYAGWAPNINGVTIPGVGSGTGSSNKPNKEDDVSWTDKIAKWKPGDKNQKDTMPAGQQLNQARGYSEATHAEVVALRKQVTELTKLVKKG